MSRMHETGGTRLSRPFHSPLCPCIPNAFCVFCDGRRPFCVFRGQSLPSVFTTDGTDTRHRYSLMAPSHLCRSVSGEARICVICGKDGGERTPDRRVTDGGRVATCCDRAGAVRLLAGLGRAHGLRPVNTERAEARGHGEVLRLAYALLHPLAEDGNVRSGIAGTREGRACRGRRVWGGRHEA